MNNKHSVSSKSAECELKKYYRAIYCSQIEMNNSGLLTYEHIRGMTEYDHMPTEDELMGDMMFYKCCVDDQIDVQEFYKIIRVD